MRPKMRTNARAPGDRPHLPARGRDASSAGRWPGDRGKNLRNQAPGCIGGALVVSCGCPLCAPDAAWRRAISPRRGLGASGAAHARTGPARSTAWRVRQSLRASRSRACRSVRPAVSITRHATPSAARLDGPGAKSAARRDFERWPLATMRRGAEMLVDPILHRPVGDSDVGGAVRKHDPVDRVRAGHAAAPCSRSRAWWTWWAPWRVHWPPVCGARWR